MTPRSRRSARTCRTTRSCANALAAIEKAVRKIDLTGGGLVGVGALLYAVARLFAHIEGTVDTIAAARKRPLRVRRLLGYVVLLVMPAVLIVGAGVVSTWLIAPLRGVVSSAVGGIATIDMVMGIVIAAAAIALVLAVLYAAAARARVPFASAAIGGAVGACLLLATMWAFATFQIGVSRRDGVTSGIAAVPVLFMWTYTSWLMVLIGAEIAVCHAVGRIVNRGVAVLIPDAATRHIIGALVMAELARAPTAERRPACAGWGPTRWRASCVSCRRPCARSRTGWWRAGCWSAAPTATRFVAIRRRFACPMSSTRWRAIPSAPTVAPSCSTSWGRRARAALATVAGVRTITSGDITLRQLADGAFPERASGKAALAPGGARARLVERHGES